MNHTDRHTEPYYHVSQQQIDDIELMHEFTVDAIFAADKDETELQEFARRLHNAFNRLLGDYLKRQYAKE